MDKKAADAPVLSQRQANARNGVEEDPMNRFCPHDQVYAHGALGMRQRLAHNFVVVCCGVRAFPWAANLSSRLELCSLTFGTLLTRTKNKERERVSALVGRRLCFQSLCPPSNACLINFDAACGKMGRHVRHGNSKECAELPSEDEDTIFLDPEMPNLPRKTRRTNCGYWLQSPWNTSANNAPATETFVTPDESATTIVPMTEGNTMQSKLKWTPRDGADSGRGAEDHGEGRSHGAKLHSALRRRLRAKNASETAQQLQDIAQKETARSCRRYEKCQRSNRKRETTSGPDDGPGKGTWKLCSNS